MSETITNGDLLDEGLQAVMGPDRCQNEWRPASVKPAEEKKPAGKEKPIASQWQPPKPVPNWFDRLKDCAKRTVLFSGLCILIFYWQQTGLMESAAAVPSMLACMLFAGVNIGKSIAK